MENSSLTEKEIAMIDDIEKMSKKEIVALCLIGVIAIVATLFFLPDNSASYAAECAKKGMFYFTNCSK